MSAIARNQRQPWTVAETARRFQVTAATLARWTRRLHEEGPEGLLALRVPVNRFPDFVAELVKFLHATFPLMGAVRMAQVLARAGLHLAPTTVRRFRRASRRPKSAPPSAPNPARFYPGIVAKAPYRLFHVDLTAVKRVRGFWVPWFPFALPQCWPFCWWVVGVVDHYSRAVLALKAFRANPTSAEVIGVLQSAIHEVGRSPRAVISDRGAHFHTWRCLLAAAPGG